MKKLLYIILFLSLFACGQDLPARMVDDNIGGKLVTIKGEPFRFDDYRGKWVVVNYWASWCGPCREEIPELNKFYKKHQDKDAIILGVNLDNMTHKDTQKVVQDFKIEFPIITKDPLKKLGLNEPVRGIPTTFMINPDGFLVQRFESTVTSEMLEAVIKDNQQGA